MFVVDPREKFERIMRGIQGALIVASTLQIVLGFSGLWRNVARFLSPLSVVTLVALFGFGLYEVGFPGVARCVEIGLHHIVLVVFSQYLPNIIHSDRHVFDRFAVLFSVTIILVYAHLLTVGGAYKHAAPKTQLSCRTDKAGLVGTAPWIWIPYSFQFGAPTFNAGEAFAMMAASFVALVELGPGSVLQGPLENATANDISPRLYCGSQDCPVELLHPPEDCNVNSSLPFTLQICRVEDLSVEGIIKGSVVHVHWVRTVVVQPSGAISASGMGCTGVG